MKTTPLSTLPVSGTTARQDRIAGVAREFESIFTSMMLRSMRNTIGENQLLPSSMGEKIYTGMLDEEYSKMMTGNGGNGLAGLIEKELRKMEGDGAAVSAPGATPGWMLDNRMIGTGSSSEYGAAGGHENLMGKIDKWKTIIDAASEKHGVDRNLVAAVIGKESAGNEFAVSRAGAKGLMQLMDSTARDMGVKSVFDPEDNVNAGVKYLRSMLDRHEGNEMLALAAYNAGPGAVDKYNGIPPYRETRNYVHQVMNLRNELTSAGSNLFGGE